MRIIYSFRLASLALLAVLVAENAPAQDKERLALEFEGGPVWQSRNLVRVPNETGTLFSLPDVVGQGPYGTFRVEAAFDINERHGFRVVMAPLDIKDSGILGSRVLFAGGTFEPNVATEANYKFSSYRATYRYRFHDGPTWRWKIGFTGFIRDARIALQQGSQLAEDTDIGFVPLAHLKGEARLSDRWRFVLELDGSAAPQGRAFDVAAKLGYALSDRWEMMFGYRGIEGGADVESVYNFAWLNFAVASIRFRL